ncbi:unnamed protein product [Bursaphelenchus xylophilus]|uniref:(pine wood nematode) hypothetical protein n=1 Tax=Bursaphelenchus xylophilus TaxID=6326 RepID=A0A7I8XNJ1_BURXY|nr:unnamed protein product [Bursaphelenchus xylophilus]CAG9080917.1 unnamed protein product [Bursaphelenchus xylophilus]
MKAVCLVFIAFAFATAVSAESPLYKVCKAYIVFQSLEKEEGTCGQKYTEEDKKRCIMFEEMAKTPPSQPVAYVALLSGLLSCSNKATYEKFAPGDGQ